LFGLCLNFGCNAWRLGGGGVISTFGCDGFWATWRPVLLVTPLFITVIIAILVTVLISCLITPLVAALIPHLLTALVAPLVTITGLSVFAFALVAIAAALFILRALTLLLFGLGRIGAQYAVIMLGVLKQVFRKYAIASSLCIPRLGKITL
jgi:hypothetical protein